MQEYKAIVNAKVVTEQEIINDGFILYGDGKIVEAGKNCGRLPQGNTEIIDARGCYVGPGFVDIHCHAGGNTGAMKSRKNGAPSPSRRYDLACMHAVPQYWD